ncbi:hypothetical protein [uncultured Sphaerochaeta sp.]|uniref:hypothetical protein n=1 Tax=uncultured Sphaerochaeta sp. TaxID=886478 RepID=UPI002A0A3709|nr:hypothetical protein [uncultured Sphaerochaeta sp.]
MAFAYGLQFLQQNFDVDYVAPQHTNQYPILEIHKAAESKGIPFLSAMVKGREEFINYCEKRYDVIVNEGMYENRDLTQYPQCNV